MPGATPEQLQAVADLNASLAESISAVAVARNELALVTFVEAINTVAVRAAVEKVRAAEFALAIARASRFATLQAGPNKLNPEQVQALIAAGSAAGAPANRGGAPPAGGRSGGTRVAAPPGRGI